MKREDWTVTESSARPAGRPDMCFYCGGKMGEQHKPDCVIRTRTAVVDFTIRLVLPEVESWNADGIESHYNESSWCSDNLLDRIYAYQERTGNCICFITKAKYVREATEDDEEMYKLSVNDEES